MQKNFFAELFDLSFSSFVTPKVVKVLYVLSIIGVGIFFLMSIYQAFAYSQGFGSTLLMLIMAPIGACLLLILARIYMELILVAFRIADKITKIADRDGV